MKKQVDISVSLFVIENRLREMFEKAGESNARLVAKMIAENLEKSEMGLTQLLLAFAGIEETTPWRAGDECLVSPDRISSWRIDRAAMKEKDMFYKDHIKAKITKIDMRKRRGVSIEFQGIDDGKEQTLATEVSLEDIKFEKELVLKRPDLADLM